jgi:two-component system, chemotaxis family, response regulator Rcp1
MQALKQPVEVLLAEDNPGDVRLIRDAFKASRFRANISVASNGEEALACLRRQGKYASNAKTDLVLLDLNMPKKDGREVLMEVRKDLDIGCTPIVILTTSDSEQDVIRSYNLRANGYFCKPEYPKEFAELITVIEEYWLGAAKLPPHCGSRV